MKHPALTYCHDVLEGKVLACEYVKLSCKRFLDDLENGHKRGLYFDEKAGQKAIDFIELLKHVKGKWANTRLKLEPWQQFIVYNLFGWKRADGTRRYRYGYVEVPRKNGKTALAAGIATYMFIADGEEGAEVYTAATTRDQAKLCFTDSRQMVNKLKRDSAVVNKAVQVYQHNMHILAKSCKMQPVSADADTLDGLNPHCAVVDEYHAHKTDEVYNVMKSGMGARSQPLQFTITTAGFNKLAPCYTLRKSCIDLLHGISEDDATFCIIYTLDKDDDWRDENIWAKVNPNYGVSVYKGYLKDECQQAINIPSQQVNFLTKNLNVWTDASEVWIPDDVWMNCAGEVDMKALQGSTVYMGLDLASVRDITALTVLFPGEKIKTKTYYWVPEDSIYQRSRSEGVPYDQWLREGHIEATPGNVTDYNFIKQRIIELADLYNIEIVTYDRHNASFLVTELMEEGVNMAPFGQGFVSMSSPTKELEKMVFSGNIEHGGDPVLRWMCRNVELKFDPAGNIKIDKDKSSEKVDGMVSLVMALGAYMNNPDYGSVYDERGFIEL